MKPAQESRVLRRRPNVPPTRPSAAWQPITSCATKPSATTKVSGPAWRANSSSWQTPFTKTLDESNAPFYKWFDDGKLNVSYNCLDRNLETVIADKTAIIFEADDGEVTRAHLPGPARRVCQFANGLKARGIKKGDRVIIYMSMSVEGVVAMQACARIGATHSVVFGGFSAKSCRSASSTPAPWPSSPPTNSCAAASTCR